MATIKPFRGWRPTKELAEKVAALPYDVMNSEEARVMVQGNEYSFLHVDKAEIDLPEGTDLYSDAVYQKARENLERMMETGVYVREEKPVYYLYQQTMQGRSQTGLVVCASVDDYLNNDIKKHELTRADKEEDRVRHVDTCDAHTGPIFLTYRHREEIRRALNVWMEREPYTSFVSEDGIGSTVWIIDDDAMIARLTDWFTAVPALYIADGHHRAASAVRVAKMRREKFPDAPENAEFNSFLAVLFPDDELRIMDYNRVVKDLNGRTKEAFLQEIGAKFTWEEAGKTAPVPARHQFGMRLHKNWYLLTAKPDIIHEEDPVKRLDVSILQENLLAPVLGIEDPRTDKRIDFVGGIRGVAELERRTEEEMELAFLLHAVDIGELMAIADAGLLMPPKSTWFEPKLKSGLFVHTLGE